MAGAMIPPDILNHQSLFSLLYQIDQDLADRTIAQGCPFAGVGFIAPIISESLGAGLLILLRLSRFVSVYVAAAPDVVVGYCRHRCGFGAVGFIGRRFFCWSPRFARAKIPPSLWSGLKGYAVYGDPRSSAGSVIFKSFSSTASAIGVCPDT